MADKNTPEVEVDIFEQVTSAAGGAGTGASRKEASDLAAELGIKLEAVASAEKKGQYEYVLTSPKGQTFKTNTLRQGARSVLNILKAIKAASAKA